ncbi:hypothetical protein BKA62DRAFT_822068 [Auriculariales sp. MPI-PUGE-AT-0066]|nr:hypothetical protein BKA62DRAFT_822068 [Auriculariales sp. MPI-PUGE-AT-0066]
MSQHPDPRNNKLPGPRHIFPESMRCLRGSRDETDSIPVFDTASPPGPAVPTTTTISTSLNRATMRPQDQPQTFDPTFNTLRGRAPATPSGLYTHTSTHTHTPPPPPPQSAASPPRYITSPKEYECEECDAKFARPSELTANGGTRKLDTYEKAYGRTAVRLYCVRPQVHHNEQRRATHAYGACRAALISFAREREAGGVIGLLSSLARDGVYVGVRHSSIFRSE